MTTPNAIKCSLLFPAVYFALGYIFSYKNRNEPDYLQTIVIISIVGAALWVFGLFLSLIIAAIFKTPRKEPYYYFAGQALVLLFCIGFLGINMYQDSQHKKIYGNIEHNRSTLMLDEDGNLKWYADYSDLKFKITFDSLQARFQNPNDFRLTEHFSVYRDSAVQEYTDTLFIIYFRYDLNDKKQAFSRIHLFEGKAELKIFNGEPAKNAEYLQARLTYLEYRKRMEVEFNKTMEEMKQTIEELDSLKKAVNGGVKN